MRESHTQAPLHRIESWNGAYYRPASLWEVGTYLLVQHHNEEGLCDTLQFQKTFLESQQIREDDEEQKRIRYKRNNIERHKAPGEAPVSASAPESAHHDANMTCNDDANADVAFEAGLDDWLNNPAAYDIDIVEDDFDSDVAITDIQNVVEYLGPYTDSETHGPATETETDAAAASGSSTDALADTEPNAAATTDSYTEPSQIPRPTADGLNNAYVRVIHTNGIHHIGMVTCSCRGKDSIPLDLFACRLLPASFTRIRTIFTAQLMDYFRLCNLELKASAYQFYQLIRRLTLPMGKSEMVNLYHEFRRMSRLWRWMKKLKWAGYGHNQQNHLNPPPGSLSIFCPTCPQPKMNLPDDWKLDKNR